MTFPTEAFMAHRERGELAHNVARGADCRACKCGTEGSVIEGGSSCPKHGMAGARCEVSVGSPVSMVHVWRAWLLHRFVP